MHEFEYIERAKEFFSADIVDLLCQVHEARGKLVACEPNAVVQLDALKHVAAFRSTRASNKIEGIVTSDGRARQLCSVGAKPKNHSEEALLGYNRVLRTINESYEHIPLSKNTILQLHRDMLKPTKLGFGGRFKTSDNVIAKVDKSGNSKVVFKPVPAAITDKCIDESCRAFCKALASGKADPLLIIPMYILDFLCIHPFTDGNGRMSRLLNNLLLLQAGYDIGLFVSIEQQVEQNVGAYYQVLQECSGEWGNNKNDYGSFVRFSLQMIISAYNDLFNRNNIMSAAEKSKPLRIEELIQQNLGKITKTEICETLPDISQITVARTLADLQQNGKISKHSGGRYAYYVWNIK